MDQSPGLSLYCRDKARVGVAKRIYGDSGKRVEIFAALLVENAATNTVGKRHGLARVIVH
jgi:hypothetical protein